MFTHTGRHKRGGRDRGMTLVEVLVAIFLLAIVGTIVAGAIISALKVTSTSTSGIESESQINDAVSRISRDVAAADPILWTSTTNGWAANTPSATELWTQAVVDDKCVRTRYWVDTAGTIKQLRSATQTYTSGVCPDELTPSTQPAVTKTLISNLKTTDDAGAPAPVFTYFDKSNSVITAPVAQPNVATIARVQIDVGSTVRNRAKGVRLITSAAPRRMINPSVEDAPPAPDCVDANWGAGDTPTTYDGGTPPAPVIAWDTTPNADTYTLTRISPTPYTWPATVTAPGTITDTAMRGRTGVPFVYSLEISGPGGTVTCGPRALPMIPVPVIGPPALTVTVTPNTSGGPATVTTPSVNLSWSPTGGVSPTGYTIWRRPLNANNFTPTGTWTSQGNTTSTTWNQQPGFNQAFQYAVTATSTAYTPAAVSPQSNPGSALTHTNNIALTGTPLTYRTNRLTWTKDTGSTVDGYALFRRPTGTSAWGTPIWTTTNVNLLTYNDTTAALDSRYDYIVTSYNLGPRGTVLPSPTTRYYGSPSNTATVLQYPSIPAMVATGTEINPDGTNNADWTPAPSATSYELWEMNTAGAAATSTRTGLTVTVLNDTGNARGTRNFYMAVAVNATGKSENAVNAALRPAVTDDAYQRPANLTVTAGNTVADGCPDVAESATNGVFSCASGTATAAWPANNADAGETTDKFCSGTNPGQCKYVPVVQGVQQAPVMGNPTNRTIAITQSNWGNKDNVAVLACNQGGCSDAVNTPVRSYPGPFSIDKVQVTDETHHNQFWENGGVQRFNRNDATAYVHWTNSKGTRAVDAYEVVRTEVAHDRHDVVWTKWFDVQNTGAKKSTAGAAYRYKVTSHAQNGLVRQGVNSTVQIPPAKGGFMQSAKFCNSANRVVGYGPSTTERVCKDEQVYKQVDVEVTTWVNCSNSNPGPDCVNKGGTPDWERLVWVNCSPNNSPSNPGGCTNRGGTPNYKKPGPWYDCSNKHASNNPGGCTNRVAENNKHWQYNAGTNKNPNWIDCNPAFGGSPSGCTNRASQEPKHWMKYDWIACSNTNPGWECVNFGGTPDWERQEWQNCAPAGQWPGPNGCTNHGGVPDYKKKVTTTVKQWKWVTERVCRDVEVPGPEIRENINEWGWKGVYKFRRGGYDNDGGQTYAEKWKWVEFVGRVSNPGHTTFQNKAMAVEDASSPPSGFPDKPKQWNVGVAYWENGTQNIDDGSTTGDRAAATSFNATEELISNKYGSGAFYSVRSKIAQSGQHATDYGDWEGRALGLVDFKINDSQFSCGTGWNPLTNLISRYVHNQSPHSERPPASMAGWNQNG